MDDETTATTRAGVAIVITSPTPSERDPDEPYTSSASARRNNRPHPRSPEDIELATMHPRANLATNPDDTSSVSSSSAPSITITVPRPLNSIIFAPTIYIALVRLLRSHPRDAGDNGNNAGGGGWGLGSNGLREREEAENRIREFQTRRRSGILTRNAGDMGADEDDDDDDDGRGLTREEDEYPPSRSRSPSQRPQHRDSDTATQASEQLPHPLPPSDSLFWRWGPLRRWRLQDRTSY